MKACTSIDLASTCPHNFIAQRSLLGEAGAGERVVWALRRMMEEQAQCMMQAVAGFAGRPSRRRTEIVPSRESERVRGKEVGMVSNKIQAGRQAHEWRQALIQKLSLQCGAAASRAAKRCSTKCPLYAQGALATRRAMWVTVSA
jgi:hypothetical protein